MCGQVEVFRRGGRTNGDGGVQFGATQASIYDAVRNAGPIGVNGDALFERTLAPRGCSRLTLKSHVHQMNRKLDRIGRRIVCSRGRDPRYYLVGAGT